MKTYIYFVRHAISPFSIGNEKERGLFEQGKQDAHKVAQLLIDEGINVIVSSTYKRASETVKALADQLNLPILEFEELRERPIASLEYEVAEEELQVAILKYFDNSYGNEFWKQTTKPDIYQLEFEGSKLNKVERIWKP